MENEFSLLMAGKYGRHITERLIKDNSLQIQSIKHKNDEAHSLELCK